MDPQLKELLEQTVRELESAAGNRVRALDVFFYYNDPEGEPPDRTISLSIGEASYLKENGYLDRFVCEYGTLSRTNHPQQSNGQIPSRKSAPSKQAALITRACRFDWKNGFKAAKLDQLIQFLAKHNFGKHYFLGSVHYHVLAMDVHLSSFAVFADVVPARTVDRVWGKLLWSILSRFANKVAEDLSKKTIYYREELNVSTMRNHSLRHVMNNIPFKATLALLADAIEDRNFGEEQTLVKALEVQDLMRDYAIDILYNSGIPPDNFLLAKNNLTNYTALLRLVAESCEDPKRLELLDLDEIEKNPANAIRLEDLPSALSLILNVWQNAWKSHTARNDNGRVHIICSNKARGISIFFINDGGMGRESLAKLNQKQREQSTDHGGVADILAAVMGLKGVSVRARVIKGRTYVRIKAEGQYEKQRVTNR